MKENQEQHTNVSGTRKIVTLAPLCHVSSENFVFEMISVPAVPRSFGEILRMPTLQDHVLSEESTPLIFSDRYICQRDYLLDWTNSFNMRHETEHFQFVALPIVYRTTKAVSGYKIVTFESISLLFFC
jgi:hypothetical protein